MQQALLYEKLNNSKIKCNVCNHHCLILPNQKGICQVRHNQSGILYTLNYGLAIAVNIDPIEKKPIFNFLPGTQTYSFAAAGCNFHCLHCQNANISQLSNNIKFISQNLSPEQIVAQAIQYNCPSISYTYTEPTIFLEYALETMRLAQKNKLKNIWVSNGFMSNQTLDLITPYLNAINIDLKAFTENFYKQICGAHLQPVLDNLTQIKKNNIHLEITTLIIPSQNDSSLELKQIANFIHDNLSPLTPWHVTAFYPTHKMLNIPPTPPETIKMAQQIGKNAGLKYIYPGNL